ncbi:MAG: ABC transporter ATP-binding protein [Gemmatimonadota bacterium]
MTLFRARRSPAASPTEAAPPLGWSARALTFRYGRDSSPVVDAVDVTVEPLRCTALLGPNGSGKSTLLRLLVRTLEAERGEIELGGRPLSSWSRRELALAVGVVPQNEEINFPLSVRELVSMGRYPHLGALRPVGPRDRAAVDAAMQRCDVGRFADRDFNTLSGGERQRARVARALAQEPKALVLDEPTLALDVRHEMEIFELVRDLSRSGVTVLLVTHNLNLAARYADALILLEEGRIAAAGAPADVLRRDLLERVYDWPIQTSRFAGPGPDVGSVQVTPLARGEPLRAGHSLNHHMGSTDDHP